MSCDESIINVDWQFNINSWQDPNDAPRESPLVGGLPAFIMFRHYDIATERMVPNSPISDNTAIEGLAYGQRHNPPAQQSYRDCISEIGIYSFFRLVVSAAPGRPSNFTEASVNINWQVENNPNSIISARRSIISVQHVEDSEAKDYFRATAMHYLMIGQHHSASVMQLYRACFRDNADQLFNMIEPIDLRSADEKLTEIMTAKRLAEDNKE